MKLKIKKLAFGAGRPVIFLNEENAKEINAHLGDRIEILYNNKKIIAILDIVRGFVKFGETALSEEIINYFKPSSHALVDINLALEPRSNRFIYKKLNGAELSKKEIYKIIEDITNNALTEAEIAYYVSGVYNNGMTLKETTFLSEAIFSTGVKIKWPFHLVADKHCIGGVPGNRTTPLVVSICAAAGIKMPKTSSRAITSAAGTADTMEAITNVAFSIPQIKKIVRKTNACLVWGGFLNLAPADDKLIHIERMLNIDPESQLIASIIAKKIAAGSKYVLIDIPYGDGAKVSKKEALNLKKKFLIIARRFKLKLKVVLTLGNQPIGNGVGPLLEIKDVLNVLNRENSPKDLEDKSVLLAGEILEMTGKAKKGEGKVVARNILDSGRALEKFEEIIRTQGKKNLPPPARFSYKVKSVKSGKIKKIENLSINQLARTLGCPADKSAGIYIHKHIGDKVKKGEVVLTFYSESSRKLQEVIELFNLNSTITID